jgi:ATP-dependent DNA helicase DinG
LEIRLSNLNLTSANEFIARVYKELEKSPQFSSRPEQHQLSQHVAESFILNNPLAAEAPTGTGKTLAYLIGALAASRELGASVTSPKPLVISTGTKALQAQLMSKDLPLLVKAGILQKNDAVLAKGKGNYFCAKAAMELAGTDEVVDGLEDEDNISMAAVEPMLDDFDSGSWDGDFDTYTGNRPKSLELIRVNSETCTGSKCPRYGECAYFKMKQKMPNAKVIVANHDLVLIDLMRVSQEQEPALPVDEYLVVFDEGHHLPEKALAIGSTQANFAALAIELQRVKFFRQEAWKTPALIRLMNSKGLSAPDYDAGAATRACAEIAETLREHISGQDEQRRYPRGVVPPALAAAVTKARDVLTPLNDKIVLAINALQSLAQAEGADGEREAADALRPGFKLHRALLEVLEGIDKFLSGQRVVKWIYANDKHATLETCPLEGADVLIPLLWASTRARAVITSATLRDLNGFERFKAKSGFPAKTKTLVLPYTFAYNKSTLAIPMMKSTPKMADRKAFIAELSKKLPVAIKKTEATLILFPSWNLMKELLPLLKTRFGQDMILAQGERPVKMLLDTHHRRIDNGLGSILCGVQTMAEGLDLPGKYCMHVIILALPFSVPADPVEQEVAEMLGSRYFMERSLPDAVTRLIQMVGRLLRRESDRGRVTIFDRRLASSSYGAKMVKALPPFTLEVERELSAV